MFGEAGNDTLEGGSGVDYLAGGAGDDTYLNVTGEDVIDDTEGNNTIQLASANGLATSNALSITNSTTLKVALDNGQTLTLALTSCWISTAHASIEAKGSIEVSKIIIGGLIFADIYAANDVTERQAA